MIGKLFKFLKEVRVELTKVSWSNRQELIGAATVVVVITALLAIFIGSMDLLFSRLLDLLIR